jgi:hypothetical protein
MPYFTIMAELRGCYADNDSAFTIRCDTRRALKQALEAEARDLRDAGAIGLSKRAVASLAADAWRNRNDSSPYATVAGFRYSWHSPGNDCMGLMVFNATRAEWLAEQESDTWA